MELPPYKSGENNSESVSSRDRGLTSLSTFMIIDMS